MEKLPEIFASNVFDDFAMRQRLPKDTYKALKKTIADGKTLDVGVANVVANAMKDWAIEKGATHYTHWFQPMTGITAEKHDSFISPTEDGHIIMEFSGKELIKGEPDASSFPSGGLRATFEARGYTAWDPTSYAFLKDNTLYIPTAFCSYSGEALDKKTPLLRSMEAINNQAVRLLHLCGHEEIKRVITTVGAEQEYFLIDKELFDKRPDLVFCGRTLIGSKPPKGQEMDDHYFGAIKPRVKAFMSELNVELWKLGVLAKTEHNEAAPAQHEMAPVFTTTNIATDHNHLIMETLKRVAERHGLVCLLHEKPFAGVNGSGKHNNWSLTTDTGINLLYPGKKPADNTLFLLFLAAMIKATDDFQDLLRICVSTPGNDHRLGAQEAPPAIVSMFVGDELAAILDAIRTGETYTEIKVPEIETGVLVLPHFKKDAADRNRTSPFAFTGNKFEFRMTGSNASIADCNIVLNTIVAESLRQFADTIEEADDREYAIRKLIKRNVKKHARIIFNGNNYSPEWEKEAAQRGLLNLKSTVEALPHFTDEKNIKLFTSHGIYTKAEMLSRLEIDLENYSKIVNIEAQTMLEMVEKGVIPAVVRYSGLLAGAVNAKRSAVKGISCMLEETVLKKLSTVSDKLLSGVEKLETNLNKARVLKSPQKSAQSFYAKVYSAMNELRISADELEVIIATDIWPYPSYSDLLFKN